MAEVTIEASSNGPYVVTGSIELRDTNGNVLPTQARVVLAPSTWATGDLAFEILSRKQRP
jgi:hypothetical protein